MDTTSSGLLADITSQLANNQIRIKPDITASNKDKPKRTKKPLANIMLKDEPELAKIYPEDGLLLVKLKETIAKTDIKFSDVIGRDSITYSTFYSIYNKHDVTFNTFVKLITILGYRISDIALEKQ